MTDFQLAQLNIAHLRAPLDSPELAGFVANLERINALAESSDGFVWRFVEDAHRTTAPLPPFGEDVIPNLSVWRDAGSLHAFVYRSAHAPIMSRRREWFERMREASMVLWWVPAGHRPTLREAKRRLDLLRARGPTPRAFTFRHAFAPDARERRTDDARRPVVDGPRSSMDRVSRKCKSAATLDDLDATHCPGGEEHAGRSRLQANRSRR